MGVRRLELILGLVVLCVCALFSLAEQADVCSDPSDDGETCLTPDEANSKAFMQWFTDRGGIANGVSVASFEGYGRGVRAMEKIQEGQNILRMPLSGILCYKTIRKSSKGGARLAGTFLAKSNSLIASYLLLEKAKGLDSPWAPYLRVLPEFVPTGWLAPFELIEQMPSAQHRGELKNFRRILEAEHVQVAKALKLALNDDDVPAEAQAASLSLDAFLWASAIVESRTQTLNNEKYLVPFVDMFNYHPHPRSRSSGSGDFFARHHKIFKDTFIVFADRVVQADEQLFMDYGDNPSEVYMAHHGFIPQYNPFDCVLIQGELSDRVQGRSREIKELLLSRLHIGRIAQACLSWNNVDRLWPRSKLNYLDRVEQFTDEEAQECIKKLDATSGQNQFFSAVRDCLETKEGRESSLLRFVEEAKFKTSFEDDLTALERAQGDILASLFAEYRVSQHRLYDQLVQYLVEKSIPSTGFIKNIYEAGEILKIYGQPDPSLIAREQDLSLEDKTSRLNNWVEQQGFSQIKIKAVPTPYYRIGAVATEDIATETPYLEVPQDAVMDAHTAVRSKIYPFLYHLSENLGRPDEFHELLLFVLFEYFVEGPRSEWWPYLSLLPRSEDLMIPTYYTQDELDHLQGHQIQAEAIRSRDEIKTKFKRVQAVLEKAGLKLFFEDSVFTEENYFWVYSLLDSRSIWWQHERHLAPLLDMVNCKAGGSRPHKTFVNVTRGTAVTHVASSYKAGEQVFEDYGQPNHIYFLYHGFSLDGNEHDCFRITLHLNERQRARLANLQYGGDVKQIRLNQHPFCVKAPLIEGNPALKTVFGTSPQALEPITSQLKAALMAMPTSLEEEENKLSNAQQNGLSDRAQSAIHFMIREKKLLHAILEGNQ